MNDQETIQGVRVVLRPATPEDEPQILDWLLRSDVTPSLLGPPLFPERPVLPPEDAGDRFDPHYLDGTAPELGHCFLILVDGEPVGQVTYNDIMEWDGRKRVELDIWMRSEACSGRATALMPSIPSVVTCMSGLAWRSSWCSPQPAIHGRFMLTRRWGSGGSIFRLRRLVNSGTERLQRQRVHGQDDRVELESVTHSFQVTHETQTSNS